MKKKTKILILVFVILISACVSTKYQRVFIGNFKESNFEFFDIIEHNSNGNYYSQMLSLKILGIYNRDHQWIRNPKNMLLFINTVEHVGFNKFISNKDYYGKNNYDLSISKDWNGKSLDDICINLIKCYTDTIEKEDYFKKFWKRRRQEKNDSIVFIILNRINNSYNAPKEMVIEDNNYDTTLYNLLSYNIELNRADSIQKAQIIKEYFSYLMSIGLDHSAYNLIFEEDNRNIKLNKDSFIRILNPDTISETDYWQTTNNAKWIKSYKDNGP